MRPRSPSAARRSPSPAIVRCSSRSRPRARAATRRASCSGSAGAPACGSTPSGPGSGRAASAGRRRRRSGPVRTRWHGRRRTTCPSAPTSCVSPSRERAGAASTAGAARRAPSARALPSSACSGSRPRSRAARTSRPSGWRCSVLADVPSFTLTFLRVGHGPDPSLRNDEMVGLEMGEPVRIDWTGKRSTRQTITVQSGDWPSGLYAARLEADDGRVGFAPFILRAATPGELRVAVVLPTNTWQAYNLYDADGDGWGDTWYAGGRPPVVLDPRVSRPRRAAAIPALRLPVSPLAREDAARAGLPLGRRPRRDRDRRRPARALRPRRVPRATRSTSRRTRTTSSSGTTPSAAG